MTTQTRCGEDGPCARHAGCERDERREALRTADINGIDYVEISPQDPHRLFVVFLHKLGKLKIRPQDVTVEPAGPAGGRRVQVVAVEPCANDDPTRDDCLRVSLDCPVGPGCYRLCIDSGGGRRLDTEYACATFRGDAGLSTAIDCTADAEVARVPGIGPAIDYLARDYGTIRQSILDRLAVTMPGWHERHAPDAMITLIEALAAVGDRMNYALDAVGTEAYLRSARRRISVRRHARLVDYELFEGANARAWVVVSVESDTGDLSAADVAFRTGGGDATPDAVATGKTFLPVAGCGATLRFLPGLDRIRIHAWGRSECRLATGTTSATLEMPQISPPPSSRARCWCSRRSWRRRQGRPTTRTPGGGTPSA